MLERRNGRCYSAGSYMGRKPGGAAETEQPVRGNGAEPDRVGRRRQNDVVLPLFSRVVERSRGGSWALELDQRLGPGTWAGGLRSVDWTSDGSGFDVISLFFFLFSFN